MKILFLDVDGVMNCQDTFRKDGNAIFPIDQYMAFLVGKIVLETGCKVVLSSSWKHHKESVEHIHKRIVDIYDVTPDIGQVRGDEIKAWLDNSKYKVDRYAILDDNSDMLPEQMPNFFKTQWLVGITDDIAKAVIEHLNK